MFIRRGESSSKQRQRSDRFINIGSDWFFVTREALSVGPYPSQEQAAKGLSVFLGAINERYLTPEQARKLALDIL